MDIPWGSPESRKFVTNVGLVTSRGSYGDNIMACEWTHHLSYSPGLIGICLSPRHASTANIKESKEFGLSIAASDQNIVSSFSGTNTGKETDKIKSLKEFGVEFYDGKKIKALMVKGAALNAECRVVKEIELGDHILFVGEVVDVSYSDKEPLVLHAGKYWKLNENIQKPGQDVLDKLNELAEKNKK